MTNTTWKRPTERAPTRRSLLTGTAAAAAVLTAAAVAKADDWQQNKYPDPRVRVLDPGFNPLRLGLAAVERLATGFRHIEGPIWFGDGRYLLFSHIPENRLLRWDEETGRVTTFRRP